jgi:hypothetical protein
MVKATTSAGLSKSAGPSPTILLSPKLHYQLFIHIKWLLCQGKNDLFINLEKALIPSFI